MVDKVALFSDKHNNLCVKLLIRHTRRPEVRESLSICMYAVNYKDLLKYYFIHVGW